MDYKNYPKVEVHRHLEGAIRLETLMELAHIENRQKAMDYFLVREPMVDLKSVIDRFLRSQELLSSYEILERIAYEAVEDAASENIKVLELRYAPSFISMNQDFDFHKIHEAILRGVKKGEEDFEIVTGLIGIMVRSEPMQNAEKSMEFFIENKDSFVGVDLADVEVGFDCKSFAPLFARARNAGLAITCHSGEEAVAEAPRFVKDAIEILGAQRIGHGLQIIHDQCIMQLVKEKGVALELCPTSNIITGNWKNLSDHPLKRLYEFGIETTLNSDDPGIFGIDLSNEWQVAVENIGLKIEDLKAMQKTALKHSFIDRKKINRIRKYFE